MKEYQVDMIDISLIISDSIVIISSKMKNGVNSLLIHIFEALIECLKKSKSVANFILVTNLVSLCERLLPRLKYILNKKIKVYRYI
jgi:hypothetical protein